MLRVKLEEISYARLLIGSDSNYPTDLLLKGLEYIFLVNYTSEFPSNDFEVIKKKSAVISFAETMDKTFERFHATCRNEVRRTFKDIKLEVELDILNWEEFYSFHKLCESERGWMPAPLEEMQQSKVIAIKYNGNYLAGMTCYTSGKYMRIGRIFSRRKAEQFSDIPGVMFSAASRRIIYEYCKWGVTHGYHSLDLGGIDPEDASKKGITRFKMYFGSEVKPVLIGRYMTEKYKQVNQQLKEKHIDIT